MKHAGAILYCGQIISGSKQTIHFILNSFPPAASVVLQSENRLVTMTRKDLSHNVLEVEHTDGIDRWLVVKTALKPKKVQGRVEPNLRSSLCSVGGRIFTSTYHNNKMTSLQCCCQTHSLHCQIQNPA